MTQDEADKRLAAQIEYIEEVLHSDRTQERKLFLINSAGDVAQRIINDSPNPVVSAIAYSTSWVGMIMSLSKRKPVPSFERGSLVAKRDGFQ